MKTVRDYLDEAIEKKWVSNDAEIARKVGVAPATVSRWRDGTRVPEDEEAVYLAEAIMADADELLPTCRALKTKDPEARAVWLRLAKRANITMSLAAMVIVNLLLSPSTAEAAPVLKTECKVLYYVKSKVLRAIEKMLSTFWILPFRNAV